MSLADADLPLQHMLYLRWAKGYRGVTEVYGPQAISLERLGARLDGARVDAPVIMPSEVGEGEHALTLFVHVDLDGLGQRMVYQHSVVASRPLSEPLGALLFRALYGVDMAGSIAALYAMLGRIQYVDGQELPRVALFVGSVAGAVQRWSDGGAPLASALIREVAHRFPEHASGLGAASPGAGGGPGPEDLALIGPQGPPVATVEVEPPGPPQVIESPLPAASAPPPIRDHEPVWGAPPVSAAEVPAPAPLETRRYAAPIAAQAALPVSSLGVPRIAPVSSGAPREAASSGRDRLRWAALALVLAGLALGIGVWIGRRDGGSPSPAGEAVPQAQQDAAPVRAGGADAAGVATNGGEAPVVVPPTASPPVAPVAASSSPPKRHKGEHAETAPAPAAGGSSAGGAAPSALAEPPSVVDASLWNANSLCDPRLKAKTTSCSPVTARVSWDGGAADVALSAAPGCVLRREGIDQTNCQDVGSFCAGVDLPAEATSVHIQWTCGSIKSGVYELTVGSKPRLIQ